jgi:1-aminocyclopropane-1-carboxylate deaminase/D-cysteine desulfhydrase-like pyridoxal-dependent ACC family enzyme
MTSSSGHASPDRGYSGSSLQRTHSAHEYAIDAAELTPLQQVGDFLLKRDDLFEAAGVRGGKARTCWALAQGAAGLVTAGSRASPQVNIVAHIAKALGVPCRVHVSSGKLVPELLAAQAAGAVVLQHRPGHNSVIVARARADAKAHGWRNIPFGMECHEAVQQTAAQAHATVARMHNQGTQIRRVVVPVGSGMSLAGILHGLTQAGFTVPVIGVVVGADPVKRLDKWAPPRWRDLCRLVPTGVDYHKPAPVTRLGDVELDPIFEAKCLPFLEPGDLFWVVGIRE